MWNKLTQNSLKFDNKTFKIAYITRLIARNARDLIRDKLELKSVD
jgi:hypothetical protein